MSSPLETPTSDDKLWAGLGYVGLACCFVPSIVIFVLKQGESAYIKFHCLQALAFGIAGMILGVVLSILGQIPVIGILVGLIHFIVLLAFIGLWIALMIQAFRGETVRLPVLADLIDQNLMS